MSVCWDVILKIERKKNWIIMRESVGKVDETNNVQMGLSVKKIHCFKIE